MSNWDFIDITNFGDMRTHLIAQIVLYPPGPMTWESGHLATGISVLNGGATWQQMRHFEWLTVDAA